MCCNGCGATFGNASAANENFRSVTEYIPITVSYTVSPGSAASNTANWGYGWNAAEAGMFSGSGCGCRHNGCCGW